jgi:uncharacterized protein
MIMAFEWDSKKDALNRKKHGISFNEACEIFQGPVLTAEDTRQDYGEVRLVSIGALAGLVVVVVVHTDRDGRVRIISARKANRKERRKYHGYLKKKT